MANTTNTNVRLPELMLPGEYPYIRFEQFRDGSWKRIDETPNNESQASGHKLGSFEETDNSSGHKRLKVGQSFDYSAKGHTSTIDLNHHNKVGGGTVSQVTGDRHSEHGGDSYHAVGGDTIHASKGFHHTHATGGLSHSSVGDQVSDHNDGSEHKNIQSDKITFIGGIKYDHVNSEYGIFTGGNFDLMVEGNAQFTSKGVMTENGKQIIFNASQNVITTTPNVYANVTFYTMNNVSGNTLLTIGNTTVNTQINSTTIIVSSMGTSSSSPPVISSSGGMNITNMGLTANNSMGLPGQVLISTGSSTYWSNPPASNPSGSNLNIQFNNANSFGGSNGFSFDPTQNNVTIGNTINVPTVNANYIAANGSQGNSGQILSSGGSGNLYWANASALTNVATLTANNTNYVGLTSAANVVSNAQLQANLANYATLVGLSGNVAALTANNTSFVGTVSAANVVSNTQLQNNLANYATLAGLSGNVVTLTSNNSLYLGGTVAASYQLNSTLAANVATMTANNTLFVGSTSAANVVSNTQLQNNLANYQTTAGLNANIAAYLPNYTGVVNGSSASFTGALAVGGNLTVTGNLTLAGTTTFVNSTVITTNDLNIHLANNATTNTLANNSGIIVGTSANLIYNSTLQAWQSNVGFMPYSNNLNLGNTSNLWNVYGNNIVGTLTTVSQPNITANNSLYLGGTVASSYQLNSTLAANVATMIANNTSFVGTVSAANVVSNTQLQTNLANYATLAGLSANVATMTANNSTNFAGQPQSYYANVSAPVFSGNINVGTVSPLTLGGTVGNQVVYQTLESIDNNVDSLTISNFRVGTGTDWTTAGTRFQEKVDSTWMGWMQFNGNSSLSGGITWGTGTSTSNAQSIPQKMSLDINGNLSVSNQVIGYTLVVGNSVITNNNITIGNYGVNEFYANSTLALMGNSTISTQLTTGLLWQGNSTVYSTVSPAQISIGSYNSTGYDTIQAYTNNNSAVFGHANYGVGVQGNSNTNSGVAGFSNTSYGVYGSSNSYLGVYGVSNTSVGVYGSSNSYLGVYGVSNTSVGGYFQSVSGPSIGGGNSSVQNWIIDNGANLGLGTTTTGNKLSITRNSGAQTQGEIYATDSNQWIRINTNQTAGSYNPMVQTSDSTLIYSNGTVGYGGFTIGQWSGNNVGLRIAANGQHQFGGYTAGTLGSNNTGYVIPGGYVTPQMYGCVGDGSTDDTTNLSTCLNSGKPVLLIGKYKISSQITINASYTTAPYGVCIQGAGDSLSQIILSTTSAGLTFNSNYTGADTADGCTILLKDFLVTCSAAKVGSGTVGAINVIGTGSNNGSTQRTLQMYNVSVRYTGSGYALTGIYLKDVRNSLVSGGQIESGYATNGNATITGATWASTGGGQVTFTVGTNLTSILSAGMRVSASRILYTGTLPTASAGVAGLPGYNWTYQVVSVTATTVVVSFPLSASPGTYSSGGILGWGGSAIVVTSSDGGSSGNAPTNIVFRDIYTVWFDMGIEFRPCGNIHVYLNDFEGPIITNCNIINNNYAVYAGTMDDSGGTVVAMNNITASAVASMYIHNMRFSMINNNYLQVTQANAYGVHLVRDTFDDNMDCNAQNNYFMLAGYSGSYGVVSYTMGTHGGNMVTYNNSTQRSSSVYSISSYDTNTGNL